MYPHEHENGIFGNVISLRLFFCLSRIEPHIQLSSCESNSVLFPFRPKPKIRNIWYKWEDNEPLAIFFVHGHEMWLMCSVHNAFQQRTGYKSNFKWAMMTVCVCVITRARSSDSPKPNTILKLQHLLAIRRDGIYFFWICIGACTHVTRCELTVLLYLQ